MENKFNLNGLTELNDTELSNINGGSWLSDKIAWCVGVIVYTLSHSDTKTLYPY